jgi:NAD+ synthase
MDLLVWGHDNEVAPADLASRVGLESAEIEAAYREIERKRVATEYLHAPAVLVDPAD